MRCAVGSVGVCRRRLCVAAVAVVLMLRASALNAQSAGSTTIGVAERQRAEASRLLQSGHVSAAVAMYRRAIVADPKDARSYYGLAVALDRTGALQEERAALQHALRLDAAFAPTHNQLGLLSMKEAKVAEAESELERAVALDPHYAEAKNNLGVLMREKGEAARAEEIFRQSIAEDGRYAQAMTNLGSLLASESRFDEARSEERRVGKEC